MLNGTFGTARVYKTSQRQDGTYVLGIVIPKYIEMNESLKPGCVVQFEMGKLCNIAPIKARSNFKKKKETREDRGKTGKPITRIIGEEGVQPEDKLSEKDGSENQESGNEMPEVRI